MLPMFYWSTDIWMTSWEFFFFVLSNMERGFENFCEIISNKVSEKGSCVCRWEIFGREGRMNKVHKLLIKRRVLLAPEGKYKTKGKGLQVVLGEQRIIVKAVKIKRYESKVKQFWQNSLFDSGQRCLFEDIGR